MGGSARLLAGRVFPLLLDGGLAFDFPLHTEILRAHYPVNVSLELGLTGVFHVHTSASLTLGAGAA